MLNAVTPFITPDPPWLANLPLVVAFLPAFGLSHIRDERARAAEAANPKKEKGRRVSGRGVGTALSESCDLHL